jgi:hypothetical protein
MILHKGLHKGRTKVAQRLAHTECTQGSLLRRGNLCACTSVPGTVVQALGGV